MSGYIVWVEIEKVSDGLDPETVEQYGPHRFDTLREAQAAGEKAAAVAEDMM